MRLWTVQHRSVVEELKDTGRLAGDWDRVVSPSYRPAYEAMAAEMARRGLDCAGRPPVWAWAGPDTRDEAAAVTAELLLGLWRPGDHGRYVVLDLDVPAGSALLTSYGRWNDFLEAVCLGAGSPVMDWSAGPGAAGDPGGVQACLPYLSGSWVQAIRDLEPSRA